jgi:hypothetical protein
MATEQKASFCSAALKGAIHKSCAPEIMNPDSSWFNQLEFSGMKKDLKLALLQVFFSCPALGAIFIPEVD